MIQQIDILLVQAPVQQPANAKSQDQNPVQSFESLLKQTAGKLNPKTQDKPSNPGQQDEKNLDGTTDKTAAAMPALTGAAGALAALVSAVQPQVQNVSAVSVQSVNATVPGITEAVNLSSQPAQSTQIVSAIPVGIGAVPGKGNGLPAVQQNAVPSNQNAVLQTGAQQNQTAAVPTTLSTVHQTASSEVTQTAQLTEPQQKAEPVQQQSSNIQQSQQPTEEKSNFAFAPINSRQSEQENGAQLQQSVPQDIKLKNAADEEKTPVQSSSSFQELMQTNNVVIKVSDAAPNAVKPVNRQIVDQVSAQYKAGKPQLEIDLYPKELGKVTVKLAMQNGALTVEIAAANPKTQSLLAANTGEIRSMLENTVNQQVHVQTSQDAQWYQQDQNPSHSRQQERQQEQRFSYQTDGDDSNDGADDFLSVIQQLRMKANMV